MSATILNLFQALLQKAENGSHEAAYRVGEHYLSGSAVEKNNYEAYKWFRRSAGWNNPRGFFMMAHMHENLLINGANSADAIKLYEAAAKFGCIASATHLGELYASGKLGVKNAEKALQWLHLAYQLGDADAPYRMGVIYGDGLGGIEKNYLMAMQWLSIAKNQGHPNAADKISEIEKSKSNQPRKVSEFIDSVLKSYEHKQ